MLVKCIAKTWKPMEGSYLVFEPEFELDELDRFQAQFRDDADDFLFYDAVDGAELLCVDYYGTLRFLPKRDLCCEY